MYNINLMSNNKFLQLTKPMSLPPQCINTASGNPKQLIMLWTVETTLYTDIPDIPAQINL